MGSVIAAVDWQPFRDGRGHHTAPRITFTDGRVLSFSVTETEGSGYGVTAWLDTAPKRRTDREIAEGIVQAVRAAIAEAYEADEDIAAIDIVEGLAKTIEQHITRRA